MAKCKTSILLYGDSGSGKTVQSAHLAEWVYATTGKKARLYSADGGGWLSIQPHVDLGIVEAIDLTDVPRPFEWFNKIVLGMVPGKDGQWVPGVTPDLGVVIFEGLTGIADLLMQDLADQAAKGINIGGQANVNFRQGDVTIGGNNQAHYGLVQSRLASSVMQSQRLPVDYVVWTALARRGQDQDNLTTILGPQAAGKALTSEIPRWFQLSLVLADVPANPVLKQPAEHRIYLRDHIDALSGNAKMLGNDRTPLDSTPLPEYIAPADLVKVLGLLESARAEAKIKVQARLAALKKKV